MYETLSKLDTVPTKEKGFINYISQFCHVSEDVAKRLYNIMQFWKKRQLQETRDNRHSVRMSDHFGNNNSCGRANFKNDSNRSILIA